MAERHLHRFDPRLLEVANGVALYLPLGLRGVVLGFGFSTIFLTLVVFPNLLRLMGT